MIDFVGLVLLAWFVCVNCGYLVVFCFRLSWVFGCAACFQPGLCWFGVMSLCLLIGLVVQYFLIFVWVCV